MEREEIQVQPGGARQGDGFAIGVGDASRRPVQNLMKIGLLVVVMALGLPRAGATQTIVAEGVIDAPVPAVWSAWTTAAGLEAWLAPHADIDLRIDGLMRANYAPAGALGDDGTIENRILAYEPERLLVIRVAKAPAGFPFREVVSAMWTVLYFSPVEGNKTGLRIVGMGFDDREESQKMKEFFSRGNEYTLKELQKHFAAPEPKK